MRRHLRDLRSSLDYLDEQGGGEVEIVPRDAKARLDALRLQALCDGILDASVLTVYEARFRKPEMQEPKWLELQAGKVNRAMTALEAAPPPVDPVPNVGQITFFCVLGYRDFRFGGALAAGPLPGWSPGSINLPQACQPTRRPNLPVEPDSRRVLPAKCLEQEKQLRLAHCARPTVLSEQTNCLAGRSVEEAVRAFVDRY